LSFPGETPAIPILPTAVAAEPDMGMIVHVLGPYRAISSNYQHVIINEAAINWNLGGNNYSDVVSQAADEADDGKAFTTDYAGEVGEQITNVISPYSDETLMAFAAATTFGEIEQVVPDRTNPDYQRIFTSIFGDNDQRWDYPADGNVLAEALIAEFNPVYQDLNELFVTSPMMTRLYTTMSAEEMTADPMFDFNADLEEVSNIHTATLYVTCDEEGNELENVLELADGRRFDQEVVTPIERQDGETVRGEDQPAAARVEMMFAAGQPEVVREAAEEMLNPGGGLANMNNGEGPSEELCEMLPLACASDSASEGNNAGASSGGKANNGCEQSQQEKTGVLLFSLLLSLLVIRQRSRAV
jgi:hypothetical protein